MFKIKNRTMYQGTQLYRARIIDKHGSVRTMHVHVCGSYSPMRDEEKAVAAVKRICADLNCCMMDSFVY